jgi:hypothetical protein
MGPRGTRPRSASCPPPPPPPGPPRRLAAQGGKGGLCTALSQHCCQHGGQGRGAGRGGLGATRGGEGGREGGDRHGGCCRVSKPKTPGTPGTAGPETGGRRRSSELGEPSQTQEARSHKPSQAAWGVQLVASDSPAKSNWHYQSKSQAPSASALSAEQAQPVE